MNSTSCQSPPPPDRPVLETPDLDEALCGLLHFSVPLIGVQEVSEPGFKAVLLDARPQEEYDCSHLPGAIRVGFTDFDPAALKHLPRDTLVVTYCSVGYRSDLIGQRLRELGFTRVRNLYGSLFEWANRGMPLVDNRGDTVSRVHTYNEDWSRWVQRAGLEKVW